MNTRFSNKTYSEVEYEDSPFFETDKYDVFRSKVKDPLEKVIEKEKLKMYRSAAGGFYQRPQSDGKAEVNGSKYKSDALYINPLPGNDYRKSVQFKPETTSSKFSNKKYETEYTSKKVNKAQETVSKYGVPKKPTDLSSLKSMLYYDKRTNSIPKTTIKNKIVENLLKEGNSILTKDGLMQNMYKLKNQNLLKSYKANVKTQKGIGKLDFIPNDVHIKATNPGYSRNALGTFFYR